MKITKRNKKKLKGVIYNIGMLKFYIVSSGRDQDAAFSLDMGVLHTFADGNTSIVNRQKKYGDVIKRTGCFLDSGAFTFGKYQQSEEQKKNYLERYIDFINSDINNYNVYAQLDMTSYNDWNMEIIQENADRTFENYQYMIERVKNPEKLCIVFHCHKESLDDLKRLLEYKSPTGKRAGYLGLAGAFKATSQQKVRIFEKCFNVILNSSYPDIKVHALGIGQPEILMRLPFTSCDSATAVKCGAYGQILYWRPEHGIYTRVFIGDLSYNRKRGNYLQMPKRELADFQSYIKEYGTTLDELKADTFAKKVFNIKVTKLFAEQYKCNYKKIYNKKLF